MKPMKIIKRNGQEMPFDLTKIENAIRNARAAVDYKDALSEGRVKLIASETAATADATPEPMRLITNQNHKLMADMDKADFDGFTKLDPTLNQAVTYIHKANELIVQYPQGSYPIRRAYAMVYSTLHLLKKCENLYGRVQVKKMKQEFYKLLRLWFYTGEPQCPGHLYSKKVFLTEEALISAMCEHNRSIDDPAAARRSYRAPRPTDRPRRSTRKGSGRHGTLTRTQDQQLSEFKTFLLDHPISEIGQGRTLNARARQFWANRSKEFGKKARYTGENRGYASAKSLASAYRTRR